MNKGQETQIDQILYENSSTEGGMLSNSDSHLISIFCWGGRGWSSYLVLENGLLTENCRRIEAKRKE